MVGILPLIVLLIGLTAIYRAYVRQIGAGAVAAGGFITLIKTIPTIISSFKGSIGSLKGRQSGNQ